MSFDWYYDFKDCHAVSLHLLDIIAESCALFVLSYFRETSFTLPQKIVIIIDKPLSPQRPPKLELPVMYTQHTHKERATLNYAIVFFQLGKNRF